MFGRRIILLWIHYCTSKGQTRHTEALAILVSFPSASHCSVHRQGRLNLTHRALGQLAERVADPSQALRTGLAGL